MNIVVVGAGYVGVVSAACLAEFGHEVTCIDSDAAKVEHLAAGQVPFFEPGLEALIAANVAQGRLRFATDTAAATRPAEVVFIAVGTPPRNADGAAELGFVFQAARDIAAGLTRFTVIAMKSTVPVGISDQVERFIAQARPDAQFAVVSNPEFLREGSAIRDFKLPDRIVIGADDTRSREVMTEVYRPLYLNAAPLFHTSRRNAELIKYAANAFLATKIAFINEIADLCEKVGGNVQEVARGIGLDNRIGPKFLNAGPGFGGSCFPKDIVALLSTGERHGAPLRIVETVDAVNAARKRAMADKIAAAVPGGVKDKAIAVLGLTYKPNTDDMREAPALVILDELHRRGARISAYDPAGMARARSLMPFVRYCASPYACAEGADALVIITEWEQFRALDLERVRRSMAGSVVVDLRNIYRSDAMRRLGFDYFSIGRGA